MCGIAGFSGKGSQEQLQRDDARLLSVVVRMDEGFHVEPGMGFGFRRLSIIDLAGGHQPLSNEDGSVWVVLNGDLWFSAFTSTSFCLAVMCSRPQSDTEVSCMRMRNTGTSASTHLTGMFAMAIWDARRERLLMARDRLEKTVVLDVRMDRSGFVRMKGLLWGGRC